MRILDTDVCIEILRGNVDVVERRRTVVDRVTTTWITAAELHYGAAKSKAPAENHTLVDEFLSTLDVFGPGPVAARRFGTLKADLERQGRRLADADLLIAAVTLAEGAILVTGNLRHYERIPDLRIEDWIRDVAGFVNEPVTPYDAAPPGRRG